jgi:HAMP domain-containing protein/signal transduction histidine kinase/DNA-binding response OmpR family regulator
MPTTTKTAPANNNDLLNELLTTLNALKQGDFNTRMPLHHTGLEGKVADTLNEILEQNQQMVGEFQRIGEVVGKKGKIGDRATLNGNNGAWKTCIESVNTLIGDLVQPMTETTRVIQAVANGDLSHKIPLELDDRPLKGEFLKTAKLVNSMVDQLGSFSSEVTRVAREVGTEGKLGGQADVQGVRGIWKELTTNVNLMADNLTAQVRNIADVTTAVANGDLSKKVTVDVKGEILELKNTVNTMVDRLSSFASEVTRVAREVGTEGKLGGQAHVQGVAGTWKDLTDNVNSMAENLTDQVRNIAAVTTAVANGDLSKKVTVDVKGEILELKNTINTMVDRLGSFASEVTRVACEVGTEGKLGGQAHVQGVAGTWKDLTDNVNSMADNLTDQVRNIADVTTAVANGNLSKKVTVDVKGEILELKNTINTMVDRLGSFASEVTRVAREVGTEGKLGGQADVPGVAGTWKDLTDNVNSMAGNLTAQVRNIAEVTTAVANGDLSKKVTVDVKGEILELKNTVNTMVDQLSSFASEVTRVARDVGTEGKLGGQADVKGVAGTWKDLTDNVNLMAGNLTAQVRNIAEVTTAVANGDLSKKVTVDVKGEILELKNTVNTMVDQLSSFASEVTRVAREVGTEGKLGGQADVKGVAGTWKDLTDNVNLMANNLTAQVRNIAEVTTAVANGDLSKKITVDVRGEIWELKNTINTMVDRLSSFASEVTRVAREVGTEGKLGGQAQVKGVAGTWKDLTDNVNLMANNLTAQVRNIAEVTTAVANGELSKKITVDVKGEMLELKNTVNTMVDRLSSFASEVTRVAREVGTEGKLGGQAHVEGVAGTWKDLTDNVNSMASNLTAQVRGIARVITAVANGDLKSKMAVEAKGEIAALAQTIDTTVETLATFAEQVTTVAREVGIEGKLGGQARVPGASGTWRDLTDNVNQLAANLTTQVRAIAEVAKAVTKGDLTRSIAVQAQGEVAALKDNINQMIANLRQTTQKNNEQDWLKTNLAKFSRILQGQRDLQAVSKLILSELAPLVSGHHGAFFLMENVNATPGNAIAEPFLKLVSTYAYRHRKHLSNTFHLGEGLVGQCALEKETILLTEVPSDYIKISSALGEASPLNIVVIPVLFEGQVTAVLELASFQRFSDIHLKFLDQLTESIGVVLNTIGASMRTEQLLKQSQLLTEEQQKQQKELTQTNQRLEQQAQSLKASEELLKTQQEELQRTNEQLAEKARLLSAQNAEVERKNQEIERARLALEEKAAQLAQTSKYKSEFLANMSHELRTPLNSLLILAKMLADNGDKNLSDRQVMYAKTIHSAGMDLLTLINEILDLAKIESGKMRIEVQEMPLKELHDYLDRTFHQVAFEKKLDFEITCEEGLPRSVYTDNQRLQQILKNLLSNAFKFTEQGKVTLNIRRVTSGWKPNHPFLDRADRAIAFAVTDTGIGIPEDKQDVIFEAFQQVDGTTSRKYGGTGLGLSITRELAGLLGGDLSVTSTPNIGSTFTLYLPERYMGSVQKPKEGPPQPQQPPKPAAVETERPRETVASPPSESLISTISHITPPPSPIADDRDAIRTGDRTLLIVEDDVNFASILLDMGRQRGFKCLVALQGDTGLFLAKQFKPDAILLDIRLPVMDGLTVLSRLKDDPNTRYIPVQILSVEEEQQRGLQLGALFYLLKPISPEELAQAFDRIAAILPPVQTPKEGESKRLLVVDRDVTQRNSFIQALQERGVQAIAANTVPEALDCLRGNRVDGVVLDLALANGLELLKAIRHELNLWELPIIVYTGQELTPPEEAALKRMADTVIRKDDRSLEDLEEQMEVFRPSPSPNGDRQLPATPLVAEAPPRLPLEELAQASPPPMPPVPQVAGDRTPVAPAVREEVKREDPAAPSTDVLVGQKVLIVDDDVRNVFALTSMLEQYRMEVVYAENGRDAIELLQSTPDIKIVLMDIMMPEMDGYQTMEAIRKIPEFQFLPTIALTAKAMKGDREKCIAAGASDYIAKPVDTEELLALLRMWLAK